MKPTPPNRGDNPSEAAGLRAQLLWTDAQLLHACEVEFIRVSGPGGQHRNKVSSGVRLQHRQGGFVVTATERRSQHENKAVALHRLRQQLAIRFRTPLPGQIPWPDGVAPRERRLRVNDRNPALPQVIGLALDAIFTCEGRLADAARALGVTSSSLARFLADHPKAWAEANRLRSAFGLGELNPPG